MLVFLLEPGSSPLPIHRRRGGMLIFNLRDPEKGDSIHSTLNLREAVFPRKTQGNVRFPNENLGK